MKTALLSKVIVTFLLIPAFILASNGDKSKGKYTKEKTINKEFTVNPDATFKVDNSYGNINIITWDKNLIIIEVHISTSSNNEEKAQKKLDEITVEFSNSPNHVSAKTRFSKNRSWWNWGNNNVNMKINYIVKMPITNNVDISNDYGNINLDKLEGRAIIDCDYGKITTKELMANNNILIFDYTNHSYFEYIKSGKINADYSSFTIGKTNDIDIIADYSKSVIEIAEDVSFNCDYGSITIEKANNITGIGNYLTTRIGDVYKNVSMKADYGSFKINNMTSNSGNINIESDYMKITIGYSDDYSFSFDIDLSYGALRDTDGFEFSKKNIKSRSKYYAGHYGNANSGNTIKINSDYGSVTFKKN